jgi:hypothetical protein
VSSNRTLLLSRLRHGFIAFAHRLLAQFSY